MIMNKLIYTTGVTVRIGSAQRWGDSLFCGRKSGEFIK